MAINGDVNAGQAAQYTGTLPSMISPALDGTAFTFYQAEWSDPLGFVPGALPATRPARATSPSPRPPSSATSPRRWR